MERVIFEVHTLNQKIKSLIESDFSLCGICVKGEVTSLNKHYTGHYYFKLRDEDGSLLSCTMFSSYTRYAPSDLKNGDHVILTGSINIYVAGGTYSFNARKIEPDGKGQYLLELKKLEEKLQKEGIFDREKRKIPLLPKKIAVLTASTGAAIHDVSSTILKRCGTNVLVFPCQVQGSDAPKSIVKALKKAYTYDIDLLILTRGGGSKDDLFAFNDEELVRTLYESPCPTITAVGHSIDTTLVDKVSDVNCITPTDAGIYAVKEKKELLNTINNLIDKGKDLLELQLTYKNQQLYSYIERLNALSPINTLNEYKNRLNNAYSNLNNGINNKINNYKYNFELLNSKISFPKYKLDKIKINFNHLVNQLDKNIIDIISYNKNKIDALYKEIEALSPTNLLLKGYSFVYNEDKKIIKSIDDVNVDSLLHIDINDGLILAKVIEKRNK